MRKQNERNGIQTKHNWGALTDTTGAVLRITLTIWSDEINEYLTNTSDKNAE